MRNTDRCENSKSQQSGARIKAFGRSSINREATAIKIYFIRSLGSDTAQELLLPAPKVVITVLKTGVAFLNLETDGSLLIR